MSTAAALARTQPPADTSSTIFSKLMLAKLSSLPSSAVAAAAGLMKPAPPPFPPRLYKNTCAGWFLRTSLLPCEPDVATARWFPLALSATRLPVDPRTSRGSRGGGPYWHHMPPAETFGQRAVTGSDTRALSGGVVHRAVDWYPILFSHGSVASYAQPCFARARCCVIEFFSHRKPDVVSLLGTNATETRARAVFQHLPVESCQDHAVQSSCEAQRAEQPSADRVNPPMSSRVGQRR